jgi:cytochrome c peroxidase
MKYGIPEVALTAAVGLFGVSVAIAQSSPPPASPPQLAFANPPHKNLKILSQDITGPQLLGTMKFFAQSLGVRCTYCHVGEEGKPLSTFDFASDAKDHKNIARQMMKLVEQIDRNLDGISGLDADAKVTCFTCHRGSTTPATALASPPAAPPARPASTPAKPERGAG